MFCQQFWKGWGSWRNFLRISWPQRPHSTQKITCFEKSASIKIVEQVTKEKSAKESLIFY